MYDYLDSISVLSKFYPSMTCPSICPKLFWTVPKHFGSDPKRLFTTYVYLSNHFKKFGPVHKKNMQNFPIGALHFLLSRFHPDFMLILTKLYLDKTRNESDIFKLKKKTTCLFLSQLHPDFMQIFDKRGSSRICPRIMIGRLI